MKVIVSGKTWYGGMDPSATDAPKDGGWPKPEHRRRGRGWQAVYEVTPEIAADMADHLETLADGFAWSDDLDARAEGRSFARDAKKIRETLAAES